MSFDARSLERLQQLGRSLPQPLPKPTAKTPSPAKPSERLHPVETEEDPEALFRELMKISPDGSVPPHLLERLRDLEQSRRNAAAESRPTPKPRSSAAQPPSPAAMRARRGAAQNPDEDNLYVAFQQLLLEDEDS